MAGLINASLNLTEIPKDRIVKGKKGQYINEVRNRFRVRGW